MSLQEQLFTLEVKISLLKESDKSEALSKLHKSIAEYLYSGEDINIPEENPKEFNFNSLNTVDF